MTENKPKKYVSDNAQLMLEWDHEANEKIGLKPNEVTVGSTKKAWWKCFECGHKWQASVGHRSAPSRPSGCPRCSAKKRAQARKEKLSLHENISKKYPYVLETWDFEKNMDVRPEEITIGSHVKIWWKCKEGHSWQTIVKNRIKGHGCPYCSGRFPLKGKNDLLTMNPFLAQEWNYERNGSLRPEDVAVSSSKKVWWRCSDCGNEWEAIIANRNKKRGCPACSLYRHISVPEKAVLFYLSKYYRNIESNKKFDWLKNMELDIFIPELQLAIEYDGRAWHKNKNRDIIKDELCNQNGISLIRIRELGLNSYPTSAKLIFTEEPTLDLLYLESALLELSDYIKFTFDKDFKIMVDVQKDYYDILGVVKHGAIESSLATKFPELLKEWNYSRNGNLNPHNISSGSSRKVWWICDNMHEWKTSVANRTNISNQNKCPYCQVKKVTKGENDLITINAPFLVDWDYMKNKSSPDNYTIHSGKKVWWICSKCGYEWESTIDSRSKHGCFKCSRDKMKEIKSKPVENIDMNIIYSSATEADIKNNLYSGAVSRCCRGERKTAGGYRWRYVEN